MNFGIRFIYIYIYVDFFFILFLLKGTDPSPYEFPIFNVSHDPSRTYPKPINYLYEQQFRDAYPPPSKQNTILPITFELTPKPTTTPNSNPTSRSSPYPQQYQELQQQKNIDWYFVNPRVTYYEEPKKPVEKQRTPTPRRSRHSSTGPKFHSRSLSRATNNEELKYLSNSNTQHILVNVINDEPSPTSKTRSQKYTDLPTLTRSQKSILKPNKIDNNKETVTTNKIHSTPNTVIGAETREDFFQYVKREKSVPSQLKSSIDHVSTIDRPDQNSLDNKRSKTKKGRLRTSKTHTATTNNVETTLAVGYPPEQPTYYNSQPEIYQQQPVYMSLPNINYSATPYVSNANNYQPFIFYRY